MSNSCLNLIDDLLTILEPQETKNVNKVCIGVDIGGTKCLIAKEYLNNKNNKLIIKRHETGNKYNINDLLNNLSLILNKNDIICSMGVSVCGFVSPDGIVGLCELPNLTNKNLINILFEKYKINKIKKNNIKVLNDAECAMYFCRQLYPKETDLSVIICGTGIGSSFLVNNNIIRGSFNMGSFLGNLY